MAYYKDYNLLPYTYAYPKGNAGWPRIVYFDAKYCKCDALNRANNVLGRFVSFEVAFCTFLPYFILLSLANHHSVIALLSSSPYGQHDNLDEA